MPDCMDRKGRMTGAGDGFRATTGPRYGSDFSAGQSAADEIERELTHSHLEDMTEKYPDICHLILTLLQRPVSPSGPFPVSASMPSQTALELLQTEKIESLVMDAEVVAIDKDTGAYRTFQDLSNRAKKDVKVEDIKVIVGVYAFDLMLLNDQVSLLDQGATHHG